jgi:formate hydrogenlyase subunit 4
MCSKYTYTHLSLAKNGHSSRKTSPLSEIVLNESKYMEYSGVIVAFKKYMNSISKFKLYFLHVLVLILDHIITSTCLKHEFVADPYKLVLLLSSSIEMVQPSDSDKVHR